MKIYIDLGCYIGKTIKMGLKLFPDFDQYIGFEPVPALAAMCKEKFEKDHRVKICAVAASDADCKAVRLYTNIKKRRHRRDIYGKGSTIIEGKLTGNLSRTRSLLVPSVDIASYIKKHFKLSDTIVLKIDIEGKEYDVMEHMIDTGVIDYINEFFCEWHAGKKLSQKSVSMARHKALMSKLKKLGFGKRGYGTKNTNRYCRVSL